MNKVKTKVGRKQIGTTKRISLTLTPDQWQALNNIDQVPAKAIRKLLKAKK